MAIGDDVFVHTMEQSNLFGITSLRVLIFLGKRSQWE